MYEVENETSSQIAHVIARRIMAETGCGEASKRQPMIVRFRRRLLQDLLPNPEVTRSELDQSYARDPLDPAYLQTSFELLAFLTPDDEFQTTTKKAASNTAAPSDTSRNRPNPRPAGTPTATGASS
jgi:hypothetical protein